MKVTDLVILDFKEIDNEKHKKLTDVYKRQTLGQFIMNWATDRCGLEAEAAGTWTSIILVFLSALCTGLNIYQKLVKFGGAGALVPITGFANSVAAPAIEFRSEGQVFGIGVKIFTIAGPVILYGVGASWILGVGYWVLQKM